MEISTAVQTNPGRGRPENAGAPEIAKGKSAMAPGQAAKVAVAAARAEGVELPRNAQGMAASAIARGADPASVFAALAAPVEAPEGSAPTEETPVEVVPLPEDGTQVAEGDGFVTPAETGQTPEEIAAGLLADMTAPEEETA